MKHVLGTLLLLLGVASGDSQSLFWPVVMIAAGAWLLRDVIFS